MWEGCWDSPVKVLIDRIICGISTLNHHLGWRESKSKSRSYRACIIFSLQPGLVYDSIPYLFLSKCSSSRVLCKCLQTCEGHTCVFYNFVLWKPSLLCSRAWLSINHLPVAHQVEHGPFHNWNMSCLNSLWSMQYTLHPCYMLDVHVMERMGGIEESELVTPCGMFFNTWSAWKKASWKLVQNTVRFYIGFCIIPIYILVRKLFTDVSGYFFSLTSFCICIIWYNPEGVTVRLCWDRGVKYQGVVQVH